MLDDRWRQETNSLTPGGASKWQSPSYGRDLPEALAQGGEDGPESPRARAHTASPDLHRQSAVQEEKPTTASAIAPPAAAADAVALTTVSTAAASCDEPRPVREAALATQRRKPKRRPRDTENVKSCKRTVRFSADEDAEIRRHAAAMGITISAYIARKALAQDAADITTRDEQLDAGIDELTAQRRQLSGVASNVNQLARDFNSGVDLAPGAVLDAMAATMTVLDVTRATIVQLDAAAMRLAKAKRR